MLDAGPSHDTAFHVVGAQFDTVFNNGGYLLQPGNPADGAAQTLNLMPGEGGFAEFTAPAAGQYKMLDHHLDHAAAGAAGYIDAGAQPVMFSRSHPPPVPCFSHSYLIKTIMTKDSHLPTGSQRKETKA